MENPECLLLWGEKQFIKEKGETCFQLFIVTFFSKIERYDTFFVLMEALLILIDA